MFLGLFLLGLCDFVMCLCGCVRLVVCLFELFFETFLSFFQSRISTTVFSA